MFPDRISSLIYALPDFSSHSLLASDISTDCPWYNVIHSITYFSTSLFDSIISHLLIDFPLFVPAILFHI